jgi:hypothetical protein
LPRSPKALAWQTKTLADLAKDGVRVETWSDEMMSEKFHAGQPNAEPSSASSAP